MAYKLSENDLFKLNVHILKIASDHDDISTSDKFIKAVKAKKHDELVKTNKWKPRSQMRVWTRFC
jgi:hypothetical protein